MVLDLRDKMTVTNSDVREFLGKDGIIDELRGNTNFNMREDEYDSEKMMYDEGSAIALSTEQDGMVFVITAQNLAEAFEADLEEARIVLEECISYCDETMEDYTDILLFLKDSL